MPLGLNGIRNQDKVKDYKLGETDYQSGQGLQTGVKRTTNRSRYYDKNFLNLVLALSKIELKLESKRNNENFLQLKLWTSG